MERPEESSMNSGAFASLPAAPVSFGKSRSARKPSRMLRMFTREREQSMRSTSDSAVISRLNTPTGKLLVQRHVLGDVHGQRGLAHARPGGDHDHFAPMQAAGHLVQVGETRWPSRSSMPWRWWNSSIVLMAFLTRSLIVLDVVLDPGFADPQDVPLHLVQQRVHLALVIVDPRHHLRAGLDHFAQQEFLPHDIQVILRLAAEGTVSGRAAR